MMSALWKLMLITLISVRSGRIPQPRQTKGHLHLLVVCSTWARTRLLALPLRKSTSTKRVVPHLILACFLIRAATGAPAASAPAASGNLFGKPTPAPSTATQNAAQPAAAPAATASLFGGAAAGAATPAAAPTAESSAAATSGAGQTKKVSLSEAPPSFIKGKTFAEIVQRFEDELQAQAKTYKDQAAEVREWDLVLMQNASAVSRI